LLLATAVVVVVVRAKGNPYPVTASGALKPSISEYVSWCVRISNSACVCCLVSVGAAAAAAVAVVVVVAAAAADDDDAGSGPVSDADEDSMAAGCTKRYYE
jgi:hypothetical protein